MASTRLAEDPLRRSLVLGGQLALTVAVTWFIVDRVGLSLAELAALDSGAWLPAPLSFAVATALLAAAYFVSAGIWGIMVRDLGGPRLPFWVSVRLFMVANLGRYVPGKVWQIWGLASLAKGRGVPATTATVAAVLGHGIAVVAAAALGLVAFLTGPDPYPLWGVVGLVLVGVVTILVSLPSVFGQIASLWCRMSGSELRPDLGSLHGLRWLGLYVLNWIMYVVSFWILSVSLGVGGAPVAVASGFAAAYVLGYVMIFAPAGLGPREGFLIMFLTPQMGVASAGVVAVVARLWMTAVELVPAGLFWARTMAGGAGKGAEGADG